VCSPRPAGYAREAYRQAWLRWSPESSTEESPTSDEEEDMLDEDTLESEVGEEDKSDEQIGVVETVGVLVVDPEELPSSGGMMDAAKSPAGIAAQQNQPVRHRRHHPVVVHRRQSARLQSDPVQLRRNWRDPRFNYYRIRQASTFSK
jgi:hypothetical protein